MQFAASAIAAGGTIRSFCDVTGIEVMSGGISGVEYRDRATGLSLRHACDVVINASGAWGGKVAALAGCRLDITPSPGTMVAFEGRFSNMVISRLHPPSNGDIVVPQRLSSIVGSTQRIVEDPDEATGLREDIEYLRLAGAMLIPAIADAPVRSAWAAPRPLAGALAGEPADGSDGRELSRDFMCVDHHKTDDVAGMYSIVGGKATVLRRMGEAVVDMLCERHSVNAGCRTAATPLLDYRRYFRRRDG
jgi:glycerol-3-phosphate dehydrogenase